MTYWDYKNSIFHVKLYGQFEARMCNSKLRFIRNECFEYRILRPNLKHMSKGNENQIATVDFNDFISGDPQRKADFVESFGNSFANMGFAIVENHGVSQELRERLYSMSERFFALDEDTKKKYEDEAVNGQRGYISKYRETAKGFKVPDLKEFYHIGQDVTDGDEIKSEYFDNIWVNEIAEFKEICLTVYQTFENTGSNLLKAIALYLDLPETYFEAKIHNGNSILRLLHYFPLEGLPNIDEGAVRAAAHGDINLITLLMGVNAEGLQAKTRQGEWLDVCPGENHIVINVGDMLSRLTNSKLRSTIHRVLNPAKDKWHLPRYSTPFFLHPRSDMDLSTLDSCVSEQKPKKYEDISAGDFLLERIRELGLNN
jgi:isopenicillin N synthase-like dioxygenase